MDSQELLVLETKNQSRCTRLLGVSVDEGHWKKVMGESVGKPGVYWWSLDVSHHNFKKGSTYYGVIHGEVIPFSGNTEEEGENVINLAIDNGNGHSIYSFGFPNNGTEPMNVFLNSNKNPGENIKVLKIALELVEHLPDEKLRCELTEKIENQIKVQETQNERVWDRI